MKTTASPAARAIHSLPATTSAPATRAAAEVDAGALRTVGRASSGVEAGRPDDRGLSGQLAPGALADGQAALGQVGRSFSLGNQAPVELPELSSALGELMPAWAPASGDQATLARAAAKQAPEAYPAHLQAFALAVGGGAPVSTRDLAAAGSEVVTALVDVDSARRVPGESTLGRLRGGSGRGDLQLSGGELAEAFRRDVRAAGLMEALAPVMASRRADRPAFEADAKTLGARLSPLFSRAAEALDRGHWDDATAPLAEAEAALALATSPRFASAAQATIDALRSHQRTRLPVDANILVDLEARNWKVTHPIQNALFGLPKDFYLE